MFAVRKHFVSLYVDHSTRQWIVRDPDGQFWILPPGDDAWEHREWFQPAEGMDLEPIPGHYKSLLNLPF